MNVPLTRRARLAGCSLSAIIVAVSAAPAIAQEYSSGEGAAASEAIVVTGSRIARDGSDAPTPVRVADAEALTQFSQVNVADSLNRLPSFRPDKTPATSQFDSGNVGGNYLDLRGLGANRTLVLVDGRRFVPNSISGTVDVNLVPSLLIDRAEIVTGGASAAYGSDAVSGVVNLLLDKDFEGLRGQAQYGQAELGDMQEYVAAFAYGGSFGGGAGHFIVGAEYVDNEGSGDQLSRGWGANDGSEISVVLSDSTRILSNPTPGVGGVPANIISAGARVSFGAPGGLITSGPLAGIQFAPDGSPYPFEYGDYRTFLFMLGGSGPTNWYAVPFIKQVAATKHLSTFAHLDYELGNGIEFFAEGSYAWSQGFNYIVEPMDFGSNTIKRGNPYIPQAIQDEMDQQSITSFQMGRVGNDFGPGRYKSTNEVYRIAAGLSGEISSNWSWDIYYQYGRTDYRFDGENLKYTANYGRAVDAMRADNGSIVCRVALTDPSSPCRPLNLFGENNWSQDAYAYAFGESFSTLNYQQHVSAANVQGDLFDLPAGPVSAAFGVEYRSESASGQSDPVSKVNGFFVGNQPAYDGKLGTIDVIEGYAETIVPLLADRPMAEKLELNGAVRFTHYNPAGSVVTWKAGLIYEPVDWLRFRASRSRDIRAPNIGDLFSPLVATFRGIVNPNTLQQSLVPARTGGNPNLLPEKADTTTIGAVIAPTGPLSGLRFSVDLYEIKLKGAIGAIGAQTLVDRCFSGATEFCSAVDIDTQGEITQVREIPFNLNQYVARGIDFELGYSGSIGSVGIDFRSLATYTKDLIMVDSRGSIDRAGQSGRPISGVSGVPHWIIYNTVSADFDKLRVALAHRWIAPSKYDATLIGPDDPAYDPSLPNSINDNTVDGRHYFDLTLNYKLDLGGSSEVDLYATVSNLLDADPPVAPSNSGATNNAYFDVVGRAYRVGTRFSF